MRMTLEALARHVARRARQNPAGYTRELMKKGLPHSAKKLGEEAVETVVAALRENDERLVAEAADLLYHLVGVLKLREVPLSRVHRELYKRSRRSVLDPKALKRGT